MNKYTRVKKKTNVFYRVLLTIIALSWVNIIYSQEICNNGIDDDSNGLIDLNDTVACTCHPPASSLIPNASFEEKNCCPSTFSQMSCAQGWVQASTATSDYMNTCGMIFPAATAAGLAPPPDGNGMAGFISSVGYQEYIGSCLTAPLYADSTYLFQLSIASTPITGQGGVCNGGAIFYGPSTIVIYGSQNCSNLPFSGQLCPPAANWQVLDSALYTPLNSWGTISFSFTPTVNINSIIIGSPCTLPASYNSTNGCLPYFYVDNLILNKTNLINTITQTGSWCHSTTVLTGDTISGASYQWYREGVAIVGQTSNILNVSINNLPVGEYSLSTTVGSICNYASVEVVAFDNPPQINTASHYCTYDGEVYLTANITGGIWSGSGITDSINGVFDPHVAQVGANLITYSVTSGPLCPRYDTMSIYVYSPPHPFAGNDTTICSGATIYMGEAPVAGYLYSWTPSTGLGNPTGSLTSLTLTNTDTLPITAHYSLIVTDAFTGCQGLDQVAIDVNPKPSITSVGPFCNTDAPVNLTASITGGVWSGNAITNTAAGTFDPSAATMGANTVIYNVSGTCAGGDTTIIQVINPPLANAGNDITMCSGTTDSIGTPPILGYIYSWQPASGLSSSTDSKPIVTAVNNSSSPVITNYILTVSSGSCIARDTVKVTVNPQPVLEISNPPAVCSPGTADITAPNVTAGTSGGGILSYWMDSLATMSLNTPAAIANAGVRKQCPEQWQGKL